MTKAMALEWGPLGICVNAIGPGTFKTELTRALYDDPARSERIVSRIPVGRPGEAGDLAGAVIYLASPASDYVTGQVLWVDGGWQLMGAGL
jgi:2-deoxy-D-gluconate 3-dehydrogenase